MAVAILPLGGPSARSGEDMTILIFSGVDLWRQGGFAHGGLLWSPSGLDREGFTLKLLVGGGPYRYVSGALGNAEISGQQIAGFAMPGWRFKRDRFEVAVFAGLDLQRHRLTPDDPTGRLRGHHVGLRGGFDLWHEPNAATMLAADASFSSVGPSYSGRAAFGWRLLDRFYLGPEMQMLGCDDYHQLRLGVHATGFKEGAREWSAAIGMVGDSDQRRGVYGRLGLIVRH
jgi:hypothetical protein